MKVSSKHFLRIAAVAYTVALAAASLVPSPSGAMARWDRAISPGVQNQLHLPAYALLTVLVALSLGASRKLRPAALLWMAAGCFAFGGALECAQSVIPGRTGSVADALVNAVGVSAGAAIALHIRRVYARGRQFGGVVGTLRHSSRGQEQ